MHDSWGEQINFIKHTFALYGFCLSVPLPKPSPKSANSVVLPRTPVTDSDTH